MRIQGVSSSLFVSLLFSIPLIISALLAPRDAAPAADSRQVGSDDAAIRPTISLAPKPAGEGVGTKDAPVDGKDGRPHLGPFVETGAERDRKKAKEAGEDVSSKKAQPAVLPSGAPKDTPETNDGVMDDPHRTGPKEGTRGTEGGITEKSKEGKGGLSDSTKSEKKPDPPKEAPPLPHSEQEKLKETTKGKAKDEKTKEKGTEAGLADIGDKTKDDKKKDDTLKEPGGLEKPADLPEKPHDIPHPVPPTASKSDPLAIFKPYTPKLPTLPLDSASITQPLHSFALAFTMILFSEIGDKTFLIAALMAMKHPRMVVFTAAASALFTMTILSAILGHAVPTLIPKRYTNIMAAILFLVFGAKMLREGLAIPPNTGVSEEMKEVEMELEEKEEHARKMGRRRSSITPYLLEGGRGDSRKTRSQTRLPAPPDSPPSSPDSRSPSPSRMGAFKSGLAGFQNLLSLLLSPAWVQTFVMTFLGEWGDRSQIATIAMAAGQDYWWVSGGAVAGHAICTGVAVIGGRAIAGRVSLRIVTLGGAFAFLAFGVIYVVEAMYYK